MRSGLVILALLGACTLAEVADAAEAGFTLREIAAAVERKPVVRAQFVQTRRLNAMQRPLVSRGKLVFGGTQGVLWQLEKPIRIGYLIGPHHLVEISADGRRVERDTREVPALAQVAAIMNGLVGGDFTRLQDEFRATAQGSAARWEVALQPRQTPLSAYLASIEVQGGRFVERIRVVEVSGDETEIRLSEHRASDGVAAEDLAAFAGPAK